MSLSRRMLLWAHLLLPLLTACSGEQWYGAGQAWQRNECFKLVDAQERSRCLEQANMPYETYQKETGMTR